MRRKQRVHAAFVILATFIGLVAGTPATARSRAHTGFDGLWMVLIVTELGGCGGPYRYPVRIERATLHYVPQPGVPAFTVAGRVGRNGAVRVRISYSSQYADGLGRLSARSGSGTWTSPTLRCSGRWTAERRA